MHTDFICITVSYVRQGMVEMGLGEEMYHARKHGEELPQFDEIYAIDCPKLVEIKNLILQMTSYDRKDRPSSTDVLHQVYAICLRKDLAASQVHKITLMLGTSL